MPARLRALLGGKADLVLSDMAPNTTGHTATDHVRIMGLAELALHFALRDAERRRRLRRQGVPGRLRTRHAGPAEEALQQRPPRQAPGQPQGLQRALRRRHRLPQHQATRAPPAEHGAADRDRTTDFLAPPHRRAYVEPPRQGTRPHGGTPPHRKVPPWPPTPIRPPASAQRAPRRAGRPGGGGAGLRRRAHRPRLLPGPAQQRQHPDPADPRDRPAHPARLLGDGHGHRGAMAIAMAQLGGIGVIHKNLDIAEQAAQVRRVKKYESGMVVNPLTIHPDQTLAEARAIMAQHHISGFPVVERETGRLVGILTNRDVRFATDPNTRVYELMTRENLITVAAERGPRRGPAAAAPAPHREAAGGRRRLPLRRPHHRQGHGQGAGPPAGQQGRAGPPARRRGHRRRRRRLRPRRGAGRRRGRRAS